MTASPPDLNAELNRLLNEWTLVSKQINTSTTVENRFYASAYFWWRLARLKLNYLTAAYAAKGIRHYQTKNSINWRPLLKLITHNDISKTDQDIWSKVYAKIHDDYDSDPKHYANDPIGTFDYYIKLRGGKTGVAGYHTKGNENDDPDGGEAAKPRTLLISYDDDDLTPFFLKEATHHYTSSPSRPLPSDIPAYFTNDRFGIVIIRRDDTSPSFVTSPNLNKYTEAVLADSYRTDFTAIPASLRCILEPLHIANVPYTISKKKERFDEFFETDVDGDKKVETKNHKRLVYRQNTQDFLLSLAHCQSSVCVISKPHSEVIPRDRGDLLLPPFMRQNLDIRLLYQRMFNMFTASAMDALVASPNSSVTACTLTLQPKDLLLDYVESDRFPKSKRDSISRSLKNLSLALFPFTAPAQVMKQAQPLVSDFKPTWQATVSLEWLRDAVRTFFDCWIAEYALRSNRLLNKTMSATMDMTKIRLGFEFQKKTEQFVTPRDLPLGHVSAKGTAALIMRSTDFSFVLRQLVDLPIVAPIELSASKDAFVIKFSTSVASHNIYVPASDNRGIRQKQLFSYFEPSVFDPVEGLGIDESEGSSQ